MCAQANSGQSGRNDDSGERSLTVSERELRRFIRDFAMRTHTSYRLLEELTGVGHETIRKWVEGKTRKPHTRTLLIYQQLYFQYDGVARETLQVKPPLLSEFLSGLPGSDPDEAAGEIRRVLDELRRDPDRVPEWLIVQLRLLERLAALKPDTRDVYLQMSRDAKKPPKKRGSPKKSRRPKDEAGETKDGKETDET